ncbi:sigma factor, partial [Pseudomonas viridiflava]|uniref:sigma factor n=1 Tax=Pseudomonas viridiflava TaxID=33069 RepID=UPI002405EA44
MPAHSAFSSFLTALYHDHHRWLNGWLRQRTDCPHNAADLAQDTFVRVLLQRESKE